MQSGNGAPAPSPTAPAPPAPGPAVPDEAPRSEGEAWVVGHPRSIGAGTTRLPERRRSPGGARRRLADPGRVGRRARSAVPPAGGRSIRGDPAPALGRQRLASSRSGGAQAVLLRLEDDLLPILADGANRRFEVNRLRFRKEAVACLVLASQSYPATFLSRARRSKVEEAARLEGVEIFHVGTGRQGGSGRGPGAQRLRHRCPAAGRPQACLYRRRRHPLAEQDPALRHRPPGVDGRRPTLIRERLLPAGTRHPEVSAGAAGLAQPFDTLRWPLR